MKKVTQGNSVEFTNIPILNAKASLEGVTLTPEDAFVLSRINGKSSIAEIQKIVGFDANKIKAIFEKLVSHSLVVFQESVSAKSEAIKNEKKITNTIQKRIREKFELLEKNKLYEFLEVERGATDEELERGYFQMSKEFHPDRFFKEPLGPFKKMLEEVFNGIQEAYQTLKDPELKKQYIQQLRKRKVQAEPVKEQEIKSPTGRSLKNVEYDLSSAESQFKMGVREEEKGNLKAAYNFYKMAMMFDSKNKKYHEALDRIKEAMKNPLKLL